MADDYKKVRGSGDKENRYRDRYAQMGERERDSLKDGKQSPEVFKIDTDSEKYDMDRVRYDSVGTKGYPRQAFDYDY